MLPDGYYAHEVKPGEHRLLWLKTLKDVAKRDMGLFGKRILYYSASPKWISFAFVNDDGSISLHTKFAKTWTPEQCRAITQAFAAITANPIPARLLATQIRAEARKAANPAL
jgi:hypothetical protein